MKECRECKSTFITSHHRVVYCSDECRTKATKRARIKAAKNYRLKNKVTLPQTSCPSCSILFTPKRTNQKYCIPNCYVPKPKPTPKPTPFPSTLQEALDNFNFLRTSQGLSPVSLTEYKTLYS